MKSPAPLSLSDLAYSCPFCHNYGQSRGIVSIMQIDKQGLPAANMFFLLLHLKTVRHFDLTKSNNYLPFCRSNKIISFISHWMNLVHLMKMD